MDQCSVFNVIIKPRRDSNSMRGQLLSTNIGVNIFIKLNLEVIYGIGSKLADFPFNSQCFGDNDSTQPDTWHFVYVWRTVLCF